MTRLTTVTALCNGEPADSLPLTDRALQFGDGLFETIRIDHATPLWLESHLQRLQRGCERLQLPLEPLVPLRSEIVAVAAQMGEGVLKVILSRGSGGVGYAPPHPPQIQRLLIPRPQPHYPLHRPAHLAWSPISLGSQPLLAGLKHLNRLEQVLARQALTEGFDEAVLKDSEGYVAEAISANLFWRQGEVIGTHPLTACGVHGVIRQQVLTRAVAAGWPVVEQRLTPAELLEVDELWITNVVMGIWSVGSLPERSWSLESQQAAPALRTALAASIAAAVEGRC